MITWILGGIVLVWILANRVSQYGKVEGEPLGMPRGTVRAFITLLIVTFPFGYLLTGDPIPPLIINAIFIVVAFYFEARRSGHDKLRKIVNEIKNPALVTLDLREENKKPLYLPKFTVRFSLVVILVLIQIMIFLSPSISFNTTNTLADVLIIVSLFIIGASFRSIVNFREKKNITEQVANMDASLSDVEIIEKIMLREPGWWKRTGKNVISVLMLMVVVIALLCYTFNWDYAIFSSPYYNLTVVGVLLLLVNVYYGFRD